MASFADLRPIIVIVCFLSLFLFLTTQMAATPEIWTTTETQRINADESFGVTNMISWNNTNGTFLLNYQGHIDGLLGDNVNIRIYTFTKDLDNNNLTYPIIQIDSYHPWTWGPFSGEDLFEHFNWFRSNDSTCALNIGNSMRDESGVTPEDVFGIRISTLNTYYAASTSESKLESLKFTVKNSKLTTPVSFEFNETAYTTPEQAWNSSGLFISFGVGYSNVQSGLNALSLISGLMFWTLPGVPTEIYVIISFVVWPPIIYVAAIWILRIIGSVFGSGGGG